jgi:hypothetical protein
MTQHISDKKWVLTDIEKLVPYENNVKKHPPEQVLKIAKAIKEFGWRGAPIQVDKNMVIINGHGRRLAALSLGMAKVPVVVEEGLTDDQIRAYRLSDNRVGVSDIDTDMLQIELSDLEFDFDGIFDKKELDFMNVDIMAMNDHVFADDLDSVMDETKQSTNEKIEESSVKRIAVDKALGFKHISGQDVIYVTRFMAQLEAQTGLQNEHAFVAFVKNLMKA